MPGVRRRAARRYQTERRMPWASGGDSPEPNPAGGVLKRDAARDGMVRGQGGARMGGGRQRDSLGIRSELNGDLNAGGSKTALVRVGRGPCGKSDWRW
jgi:hypothetical protein